MIPVGDVIPSRTPPRVTVAILVVYAAAWLMRQQWPGETFPQILTQGVAPAHFSWLAASAGLFLHVGLVQAASNAIALWICGRTVEDRLGHARFLTFYLLTGYAGSLAAVWAAPASVTPVLAASAAVGGVIGGYLALFPKSRILILVPSRDGLDVVEIPAAVLPGFWFLSQLLWSLGSPPTADSSVGMWAHLGGGAAGALAVWIFRQPARLKVEWWGA